MKKILKLAMLGLFGGVMLASCSTNKTSSTTKDYIPTTSQSEETTVSDYIKTIKTTSLVKSKGTTIDLASFFEFKGQYDINDIKFSITGYEDKAKIEGSKLTVLDMGDIYVTSTFDSTNHATIHGTVELKTIIIFAIEPTDVINKFVTTSFTDDTYKMTLETKEDKTFTLYRPAGTCSDLSTDEVTEATITGTYELKDDGIIYFTVDEKSKEYACDFKMQSRYGDESKDKEDYESNDFFMFGYVPVTKDSQSKELVRFSSIVLE